MDIVHCTQSTHTGRRTMSDCLTSWPHAAPQPSPHRRDERPVSCYTPSSNSHLQPGLGSAGRDAIGLAKDKQRAYMPSLVNNETYGTILNANSPQSATTSAPPLPPRNLGELSHSDISTI